MMVPVGSRHLRWCALSLLRPTLGGHNIGPCPPLRWCCGCSFANVDVGDGIATSLPIPIYPRLAAGSVRRHFRCACVTRVVALLSLPLIGSHCHAAAWSVRELYNLVMVTLRAGCQFAVYSTIDLHSISLVSREPP